MTTNPHSRRHDMLSQRILRLIDRMWREHDYEMMTSEAMWQRIVCREMGLREHDDLQQAGIIPVCKCEAARAQALSRLGYYMRRFRDKKERPFVSVHYNKNTWLWVHVRGMCYLASRYPDRREMVMSQLEQVRDLLMNQGLGAIANANAITHYVGDLAAGKSFAQPELLGAA